MLYAKTYTVYITKHGISFIDRFRDCGNEKALPFSFPYHKLEALRIHIARPMIVTPVYYAHNAYPGESNFYRYDERFAANMNQASNVLRRIVKKEFPLRKLIIDAWSPCGYHGVPTSDRLLNLDTGSPSSKITPTWEEWASMYYPESNRRGNSGESLKFEAYSAMHADTCGLFDMLSLQGMAQSCEIVLGAWAQNCTETIQVAQYWGHAALCHNSRNGDDKEEPEKVIVVFKDKGTVRRAIDGS